MQPTRRDFLIASTAVAGTLSLGGMARSDYSILDEPTWLTYAVNVETFWGRLPFLERLKKVAEAGFGHYEFARFRAKDILAIDKLGKELGLTPVQFTAFEGVSDPKKKESFLESMDDAIEVADKLGVKKLVVSAGPPAKGLEHDAMIDAAVEALKEAVEKVKEHEITILLAPPNLADLSKSVTEVIEAVGSSSVRLLLKVDQPPAGANLPDLIKKHFDKIGYFQLDLPGAAQVDCPGVLKTIHDLGYKDQVGVGLKLKGDPVATLKGLRDADAAAKAKG